MFIWWYVAKLEFFFGNDWKLKLFAIAYNVYRLTEISKFFISETAGSALY
jgi:hypothetical protein